MKTLGLKIREERTIMSLTIKELAKKIGISEGLLGKIERDERIATKEQIELLVNFFCDSKKEILSLWLGSKLYNVLDGEVYWKEGLKVAESVMEYNSASKNSTTSTFLDRIEILNNLKTRFDKIRDTESFRIQEALEIEYTHDSNRIEGNTLTLQETSLVVNKGITIANKSMQEHLEAINHYEAIQWIKELVSTGTDLTKRVLLDLHYLILRGIDRNNAGIYRNVPVIISGSKHIPTAPYLIDKEMEDFFIWYEVQKHVLHPVILAAEVHFRIVSIHPFIDGNGRTCRLLMNLILLSHGYVIANIRSEHENRMQYYRSLENANSQKNSEGFIEFIFRTEIESFTYLLSILEG